MNHYDEHFKSDVKDWLVLAASSTMTKTETIRQLADYLDINLNQEVQVDITVLYSTTAILPLGATQDALVTHLEGLDPSELYQENNYEMDLSEHSVDVQVEEA